jgi:ADP-ribose pyrophosphatase YjhB (NUDIX family)
MGKKIICRTPDEKKVEVDIEELSFRPSVYGVVIENNNVLLVPQWGDGYDIPGGGVELGELLTDALVREVKEESGIDIKPIQPLHVSDDFFFHPIKKKPFQTPLIYFLCEKIGGRISDANFAEDEKEYSKVAEWVPLNRIRSLKFYNPVDSVKIIEDAVRLQNSP